MLNTWVVGLVESLAETIGPARALGFEPELFLETIAGGPLDSAYAQLEGKAMAAEEFPPSFPLRLARKDADLVLEAAEARAAGHPGRPAPARAGAGTRPGDDDLAAVAMVVRPGVERCA